MRAIDKVYLARDKDSDTSKSYINNIFTDFTEFHGDRKFGDDKAIIGGIAMLRDIPVTVIGIEKGTDTKEKVSRNFGSAHPEGYRKALRLMKQAEKFQRPIVCFIDTSGAYCGIGAEERGQGMAIAENLMEMMSLTVPIVSILVGEGGSGGALALGVANEVWMLENAVYSVISPEGCASILYKDSNKAAIAAENLKLTADDLFKFNIIERIINEEDNKFETIKNELISTLSQLMSLDGDTIANQRYDKFRKIGDLK